jgi:hypothetical protein
LGSWDKLRFTGDGLQFTVNTNRPQLDRKHIDKNEFNRIYSIGSEAGKMINGQMEYLNKSSIHGQKFKDRQPA